MSFDIVLLGGTFDLVWRKLMSALFQAFRHGPVPEGGRIIGVARDNLSQEQEEAWRWVEPILEWWKSDT